MNQSLPDGDAAMEKSNGRELNPGYRMESAEGIIRRILVRRVVTLTMVVPVKSSDPVKL